jgi:hypothetical protein
MAQGHPHQASPAQIAEALKGIDFPKSKPELVEYARPRAKEQNNPDVVEVLQSLPDREYGSMADVEQGVGKIE